MKSFLIQYGRFFLLAFVAGFLLPHLDAGSVQGDVLNYDDMKMDEMILAFHADMNTTVNEKLEQLFDTPDPNVLYPSSKEGCTSDNLSTYCLGVELNTKLLAFETALLAKKSSLEELQDGFEESSDTSSSDQPDTLSDAVQFANQQALVVDEQIQNAENALDLTLAVYNQVQIVYPLHEELESFRENLENFRDNLAAVRDVIELYPSKFNGASTAQCK